MDVAAWPRNFALPYNHHQWCSYEFPPPLLFFFFFWGGDNLWTDKIYQQIEVSREYKECGPEGPGGVQGEEPPEFMYFYLILNAVGGRVVGLL